MKKCILFAIIFSLLFANAALFAEAGIDTTVYARGQRLAMLRAGGLMYAKGKRMAQANVRIVDKVAPDDVYDFVFLTVKENQVHTALKELRENTSSTIVTMVNTLEPYSAWEALCGEGQQTNNIFTAPSEK
mgnify:CR=1 FL=1